MKETYAQRLKRAYTVNLEPNEQEKLFSHSGEELIRKEMVEVGDAIAAIFYAHTEKIATKEQTPLNDVLQSKKHINKDSLQIVRNYLPRLLEDVNVDTVFNANELNPSNYPHNYSKTPVYENRIVHFSIEGFVWTKGAEAQNHTHEFDCGAYVHQGSLVETDIGIRNHRAFPTKFKHLTPGNLTFRDPNKSDYSGKNGHNVTNPVAEQSVSFHIYAHDKSQAQHANKDVQIPWKAPYNQHHAEQVKDCAEGWHIVARGDKHCASRQFAPKQGYTPETHSFVKIEQRKRESVANSEPSIL